MRRIRRDERGFVLPVAVIILLVLLLTMTALTLAASDNTTTSRHTGSSAQALSAAQAAEQLALYRLDNAPTSSGATSGTGTLGDGASYSYTVTSLSSSSSPCAGLYVESSGQSVNQDCIKATGTAGGVSQTVEERVAGYVPQSLFPVAGVFAINSLNTTNAPTGTFDIGTNGTSSLHGEAETGKLEYTSGNAPNYNGTQNTCGNAQNANCVVDQLTAPITVPSVSGSFYEAALQSNNDAAINWSGCGSVSYTASTHEVSGSSNGCVFNIPSGTYYFCKVYFSGSTTLNVTAPAYIYVDSSYDAATGNSCPSGDGSFGSGNVLQINNSAGATGASGVQMYFYGQPGCTTSCPSDFNYNGSTLDAYVFAPDVAFSPGNAFTMDGALVTAAFSTNNALTFNYEAPTTTINAGASTTTYYPSASSICSDSAGSGC